MFDVIIIGTSVERIICAINLLKYNIKVLLIESKEIEYFHKKEDKTLKYISKYVDINNYKENIISLGGEIVFDDIVSIDTINKNIILKNNTFKYNKLVLCFGLIQKLPNIPNIDKYIGKGVHFCIHCDKDMYNNKTIGILGNNIDIKDILELSNISNNIILFNNTHNINKINNIKIINKTITNLIGEERLNGVLVNDEIINVKALFISNGYQSNTKYIDKFINKFNLEDIFIEKETNELNISEGLFISKNIIDRLNI